MHKQSIKFILLNNPGKLFSVLVGITSLDGYRRTVLNDNLKQKSKELEAMNDSLKNKELELENKMDNIQIKEQWIDQCRDYFINKSNGIQGKIIAVSKETNSYNENISTFMSQLNDPNLSLNQKAIILTNLQTQLKLKEEALRTTEEITAEIKKTSENFLAECNNEDNVTGFIAHCPKELSLLEKLDEFIHSASPTELSSIGHISLFIFIFFCLFGIVNVIYGDIIVIKFNLKSKFPKIAALIKLRSEFKFVIF